MIAKLFKTFAWIFALTVLAQVFLAGLSLFYDTSYWSGHAIFGRCLSAIPVLMLILALWARLPRSIAIQCLALIGMIVLIMVTAIYAADLKFVSALHPVIAVFLFFRTMAILKQIDERRENR